MHAQLYSGKSGINAETCSNKGLKTYTIKLRLGLECQVDVFSVTSWIWTIAVQFIFILLGRMPRICLDQSWLNISHYIRFVCIILLTIIGYYMTRGELLFLVHMHNIDCPAKDTVASYHTCFKHVSGVIWLNETKSATMNIFQKKSFLFKSFVKAELS